MAVLETNAARVNEQLRAIGKHEITAFHPEARPLPSGRIVTMGLEERMLADVQVPGTADVIGDRIIVLDKNRNVVWTWDAFDNLDVTRKAVLGETCSGTCPPPTLAKQALDWTHGNSIQQTPDGNFLYSSRHPDWLIKIASDDGDGDGHVIWRMGPGGDFTALSGGVYPWFSHQHDASVDYSDPSKRIVFDDGNTRIGQFGFGKSRGQVFPIDEVRRVATPVFNADLGVFSAAVGPAQKLLNADFHFDAGFVVENGTIDADNSEVTPAGGIVYNAHANVILYRRVRLPNLHTVD